MLTDNGNIVISQKPQTNIEDYEWLRNTGLGYIQKFSGKLWTDYNLHDPGITILELLCYALTDLAYRLSFPVADTLTAPDKKGPNTDDFFTARKILTTHPVTISDYRKLILDRVPGVRNIWFETLDTADYLPAIYYDKKACNTTLVKAGPDSQYDTLQLKGLYVAKLDAEDFNTIKGQHPHFLKTLANYRDKDSVKTDPEVDDTEYESCLLNFTKTILLDSRNLCEDFEIMKVADYEWVAVCADIELTPDASADTVFLEIYNVLYNYINPSIKFSSFKELIEKGKRTEDIFNGAAVTRGFIDDETLAEHGHIEVLYVSDIINKLMDIDGVLQVKSIHLSSYDKSFKILENAQQYCLHLTDKLNSVFQFIMDAGEQTSANVYNHIRFSKGPIYFSPERKIAYQDPTTFVSYPDMPQDFVNDLPIPSGKNRELLNYYSVQNDFPLTYYTGMDGIPNSETTLRKAQRLQTKAFLLFFDQVLADYLSMLNNIKNVFTWRGGFPKSTILPFQLNESMIKDLRELLAPDNDFESTYNTYSNILESKQRGEIRQNKVLDHLLARFNELFVDYTVFKFKQDKSGNFFSEKDITHIIEDKINFLKLYPIISGKRSHAFNYTKGIYGGDNLSGLQLRLQKMMGLTSTQNTQMVHPTNKIKYKVLLANIVSGKKPTPNTTIHIHDHRFSSFENTFGIHVLEHILLRPLYDQSTTPITKLLPLCGDGTNNQHAECLLPDYYSFQLTVVLPGWLSISSSMDFRQFTENLIRSEAPAHVALKICWLDPARMFLFEQITKAFFDQMAKVKQVGGKPSGTDILNFNTALQDVYTMMGILKNVYPASKLDKCDEVNYNTDTDAMNAPFILNYSALGAAADEEWFTYLKPKKPVEKIIQQKAPAPITAAASVEVTPESAPIAAKQPTGDVVAIIQPAEQAPTSAKKAETISNVVSATKAVAPKKANPLKNETPAAKKRSSKTPKCSKEK